MSTRFFSEADQLAFAHLSGDVNPIHLDESVARRLLAGKCIVHGIHALLWALEEARITPISLQAKFLKPIFVGETVKLEHANSRLRLNTLDGAKLVDIKYEKGEVSTLRALPLSVPVPRKSAPLSLTMSDHENRHGALPGGVDESAAHALFPFLAENLGVTALGELVALSYLIGMECPGLHSLLTALRLSLQTGATILSYTVTDLDLRFNHLEIAVAGRALTGSIEAFHRPSQANQADMAYLAALVHSQEFAGQQALVIGGSRGLGEVTAKILAAGGARVTITYSRGAFEAQRVAQEITAAGGVCHVQELTVSSGGALSATLPKATHIYYFATPKIFGKRGTEFDAMRLQAFMDIYVAGFEAVWRAAASWGAPCVLFYPSSVALDEKPIPELMEYCIAKAAGEMLTIHLAQQRRDLPIVLVRLPRSETDQTVTLMAVPAADPSFVMLPLVRQMQTAIGVETKR